VGRGRRTDEALQLCRRLWTAEEISHSGQFFHLDQVRIHPAPLQPGGPPIIVAGRQEVAMRRAARLGDGWMPYLYSPRRYAASVQRIRAIAAEDGRELDRFEWCAFLFVNVSRTREQAVGQAAAFLGGNYGQDFNAMVSKVAVVGTASDVREQLQAFVDAGARHLIVATAGHPRPAELHQQLAEEIVPMLEGRGAEQ
jgi:alkanesulfonate monooxygenase SsuD/methylene tetrahydromethanopterin reductase-like flavin-dependent oxidoreductase (luciferase family)